MLSFGIIEKFDVIKDIITRRFTGSIGFAPDALSFQKLEKTFCHSIIIAVSLAAHAHFQMVLAKESVPLMTGKLTAVDRGVYPEKWCGEFELFFLNHVHEFNACECSRGGVHFPEISHGRCDPIDVTVILLNDIVQIFGLAQDEVTFSCQPSGFVEMLESRFVVINKTVIPAMADRSDPDKTPNRTGVAIATSENARVPINKLIVKPIPVSKAIP